MSMGNVVNMSIYIFVHVSVYVYMYRHVNVCEYDGFMFVLCAYIVFACTL